MYLLSVIVALVHIFHPPNNKIVCCFVIEISDEKLNQWVGWSVNESKKNIHSQMLEVLETTYIYMYMKSNQSF